MLPITLARSACILLDATPIHIREDAFELADSAWDGTDHCLGLSANNTEYGPLYISRSFMF